MFDSHFQFEYMHRSHTETRVTVHVHCSRGWWVCVFLLQSGEETLLNGDASVPR